MTAHEIGNGKKVYVDENLILNNFLILLPCLVLNFLEIDSLLSYFGRPNQYSVKCGICQREITYTRSVHKMFELFFNYCSTYIFPVHTLSVHEVVLESFIVLKCHQWRQSSILSALASITWIRQNLRESDLISREDLCSCELHITIFVSDTETSCIQITITQELNGMSTFGNHLITREVVMNRTSLRARVI